MPGIFIAATRQHVGKSTTSLGLMGAMIRRVPRETVGFFKPVGQQHEVVGDIRYINAPSDMEPGDSGAVSPPPSFGNRPQALPYDSG